MVYERGHLGGPEIFRFGLWMTLVRIWWSWLSPCHTGQPPASHWSSGSGSEPPDSSAGDGRVDRAVKVCRSKKHEAAWPSAVAGKKLGKR